MVFSGIVFLYYFLPAVLMAYFLTPRSKRNIVLFVSSLIFYAWGEPKYVFLMLITITVGYLSGLLIEYSESGKERKIYLVLSIVINLSFLVFFKYTDFLISSVNTIAKTNIPLLKIALPIGISFYTFQTLSYSIDVYRKDTPAQKSFLNFGTYVSMFPQLVAGPIVRYKDIARELSSRKETFEGAASGITYIVSGLAKKVLIANNIGMLWTDISSLPVNSLSVSESWLGIIAYTFQIYFDFSGYSDIAIGLGKIFGFNFVKNFDYPYTSKTVTEFWRRWHISLGTWFKEYVYIPLGGNRCSKKRLVLNLLIVWGLTGLWHGASLNFIVWGLYYGIILIAEKMFFGKYLRILPDYAKRLYTLFLVVIGWVFFSAPDIKNALSYISAMFGGNKILWSANTLYSLKSYSLILIVSAVCSTPVIKKTFYRFKDKDKYGIGFILVSVILMFIITAYLVDSTYNPFLYFRF